MDRYENATTANKNNSTILHKIFVQLLEPQHPRADLHVNKESGRFYLDLVRGSVLDGRLHVQLATLRANDFRTQNTVRVLSDRLPRRVERKLQVENYCGYMSSVASGSQGDVPVVNVEVGGESRREILRHKEQPI